MDDKDDPKLALAFDLLFRGLEITTGGQRIHDYQEQMDKLAARKMNAELFESFTMLHKYGMPPHGGLGIGLERLTMYLQGKDSVYDIQWNEHVTYGQIYHQNEVEQSRYNFDESDAAMHREHFDQFEAECLRLTGQGLLWPAYAYCLKCSHTFNLLDARGAISITERTGYIGRVRTLASSVAHLYAEQRKEMGYPMLGGNR